MINVFEGTNEGTLWFYLTSFIVYIPLEIDNEISL